MSEKFNNATVLVIVFAHMFTFTVVVCFPFFLFFALFSHRGFFSFFCVCFFLPQRCNSFYSALCSVPLVLLLPSAEGQISSVLCLCFRVYFVWIWIT